MIHSLTDPIQTGAVGVYAFNQTGIKYDNFQIFELDLRELATRRVRASVPSSLPNGAFKPEAGRGGVALIDRVWEDDFIFQSTVGDEHGTMLFRRQDPINYYSVHIEDMYWQSVWGYRLRVERLLDGWQTNETVSALVTGSPPWTVRVKVAGQKINVWVDGTQVVTNYTLSTAFADGAFGFRSSIREKNHDPTFDNVKIGYDNNADNDIDDIGDDVIYTEDFAATTASPTYDANGNLTEDAWYQYVYDAWNRLVNVKTRHDGRTIGAYAYDATGRRIKKVVTDSGDRDGTEYFYYAGPQLIEVRDGSENALRQFVWGTQYIDEPITLIDNPGVSEKWYFYHQDANFNVVMLTDENGLEAEHYEYTPYGQLAMTDANFRPISESAFANPFTYTGRYHDVETDLYYYRARHYHPTLGRFPQRDPIGFADGLNLYQYGHSGPVNALDPYGQKTLTLIGRASIVGPKKIIDPVKLERARGRGPFFMSKPPRHLLDGPISTGNPGSSSPRGTGVGSGGSSSGGGAGSGGSDPDGSGAGSSGGAGENAMSPSALLAQRRPRIPNIAAVRAAARRARVVGTMRVVAFQDSCSYGRKRNCVTYFVVERCNKTWVELPTVCSPCAWNPGPAPGPPPFRQPSNACCAFRRNPTEQNCKDCCWDLGQELGGQVTIEWLKNCETGKGCSNFP